MKPNEIFLKLPKNFWACVRLISQGVGYTQKLTGQIKIPTNEEIKIKLESSDINFNRLQEQTFNSLNFGELLHGYFDYRANTLNTYVEPRLMNVIKARKVFEQFLGDLKPLRPIPMNKQKGTMKTPAYLTGLVNTIIEANLKGLPCDYDPRKLTNITRDGLPIRTFAR